MVPDKSEVNGLLVSLCVLSLYGFFKAFKNLRYLENACSYLGKYLGLESL